MSRWLYNITSFGGRAQPVPVAGARERQAVLRFMKIPTILVALVATCCFIGCSNEDSSPGNSMLLVPPTAAKVIAATGYTLEHTTESGIKCYVRPLTPEIARTITVDNPDFEFLHGDDVSPYYLLVLIRNGKIIDTEAAAHGAMSAAEGDEVASFVAKREPKTPEPVKAASVETLKEDEKK